jgi:hypothetical protein
MADLAGRSRLHALEGREDSSRPHPRDRARKGELAIFRRYDHWAKRHVPVASLQAGPRMADVLPALDSVRIMQLSGPQFVLVGDEASSIRKSGIVYRQAWWCRVVIAEAAADSDSAQSRSAGCGSLTLRDR